MSIDSKESRETQYWINLLIQTDYIIITEPHVERLLQESNGLTKLLTSIVKTAQLNKNG